jgi:hypothetical protein
MRFTFVCRNGRLTGFIDPHLRDTRIDSKDEDLESKLKALFGKISLGLSSPADGTRMSGKVAVSDTLTDPGSSSR